MRCKVQSIWWPILYGRTKKRKDIFKLANMWRLRLSLAYHTGEGCPTTLISQAVFKWYFLNHANSLIEMCIYSVLYYNQLFMGCWRSDSVMACGKRDMWCIRDILEAEETESLTVEAICGHVLSPNCPYPNNMRESKSNELDNVKWIKSED